MITQTLTPHKIGWIKCSFLKCPQLRDVVSIIRVQFSNVTDFDYSDFNGFALAVYNSLKIMFQNFTFWCYPSYHTCLLKSGKKCLDPNLKNEITRSILKINKRFIAHFNR